MRLFLRDARPRDSFCHRCALPAVMCVTLSYCDAWHYESRLAVISVQEGVPWRQQDWILGLLSEAALVRVRVVVLLQLIHARVVQVDFGQGRERRIGLDSTRVLWARVLVAGSVAEMRCQSGEHRAVK